MAEEGLLRQHLHIPVARNFPGPAVVAAVVEDIVASYVVRLAINCNIFQTLIAVTEAAAAATGCSV